MIKLQRYAPLLLAACIAGLASGCAPLIIGGGAEAGLMSHDPRSLGEIVDDHLIEVRARADIDSEKDLRQQTHVSIDSEDGTVLLTGQAPTPEMRDKILALVQAVPHVKRIVNAIDVAVPSTVSQRTEDSWITTQVKGRLLGTHGVDATHVRVITSNQIVYLMGLVPAAEAKAAADAASDVPNVRKVVDLFEVQP